MPERRKTKNLTAKGFSVLWKKGRELAQGYGIGVQVPRGQERPWGHCQPLHAQRHTAGEASVARPCTMAKGTAPFQVQQLKEMIISRKETPLTSIRELICT